MENAQPFRAVIIKELLCFLISKPAGKNAENSALVRMEPFIFPVKNIQIIATNLFAFPTDSGNLPTMSAKPLAKNCLALILEFAMLYWGGVSSMEPASRFLVVLLPLVSISLTPKFNVFEVVLAEIMA
jgi:hypothetical protein